MHDTRNSNSEMSLSALGEIGYHGPAEESERPQVLWSDLNCAFGYERACFKAVHECWSHELEELPYSTGITRLPPTRPRTLHDADEVTFALGLREDNFAILNRVTNLNLSGHRLMALPDRLVMLKNLRSLDASDNCLVALPVHLATLSNLTYLNVSENSALLGDLPESVLQLRHLCDLLLANTGLVRISKSIAQLRDLALLDVSGNCVTSLPRKELAAMPKLVTVACQDNPRVAQRVCGIPEEVARGRGTTMRVRDGDRHANIPLSDTWNWTPDGVLGYLRHRPHAFVTVRKMDGQQTNGWVRSSTAVVLEAYGAGDKVTFLIDELVRLIIFQRRDPFPAAPRGPQLAYAPVADAVEVMGKKRTGKKGGKKAKTKNGEQRQAPLDDKYYVAGRIHDIWLQFQVDYAHLTKSKPGHEAVFFKHLVAAMNKTSLLSTVVADLQRLLKVFKKRFAKDGFPFPLSYLKEGRPVEHFPGTGASKGGGAKPDDDSAVAQGSHKIPGSGLSLPLPRLFHVFVITLLIYSLTVLKRNPMRTLTSFILDNSTALSTAPNADEGAVEEVEQPAQGAEVYPGKPAPDLVSEKLNNNNDEESDDAAEEDEPPTPADYDDEADSDDEEAEAMPKVKKFDVWEFHGVMFLGMMEIRANGHLKGTVSEKGKKGKGKKKKK